MYLGFVAEGEGLDETLLGDLVGGTLDHEHVLLGADVDQDERRGVHLLDRGVGQELAVDQGDAHAADRAAPRDVGDGERGAGAVNHRDIGVVDLVGRHQLADDLDLVEQALGEEGAARTVAQAGGEDLLLGRTALALEKPAGYLAGGIGALLVIDGKRQKIFPGIGLFSADVALLMAGVLQNLGSQHVLLVHSDDHLDEISIAADT